jgi:uncharacterized oxidoreductase
MNITNKTVLITGGSAGIGFQIAKQLIEKGNQIIITGRNEDRLKKAAAQLNNAAYFAGDVTNEDDVNKLVDYLAENHPNLDVLINNAGNAFVYQLAAGAGAFEKAGAEMLTNYLSIIRLTEKLLPQLTSRPEAAIVNVTSIVVFAPSAALSTYAASKAALHSYTQSLRYTLKATPVKVFELMPPLVDTEFSKEIGGSNGIPPQAVATSLLEALESDTYEIHTGDTAHVYKVFLSSPQEAFNILNSVS